MRRIITHRAHHGLKPVAKRKRSRCDEIYDAARSTVGAIPGWGGRVETPGSGGCPLFCVQLNKTQKQSRQDLRCDEDSESKFRSISIPDSHFDYNSEFLIRFQIPKFLFRMVDPNSPILIPSSHSEFLIRFQIPKFPFRIPNSEFRI
jgi:hypothetical protein